MSEDLESRLKKQEGYSHLKFPWVPDMVQAYKFGMCELCEKEKSSNQKFDNSTCPHCKKHVKCFSWMRGDDNGNGYGHTT